MEPVLIKLEEQIASFFDLPLIVTSQVLAMVTDEELSQSTRLWGEARDGRTTFVFLCFDSVL